MKKYWAFVFIILVFVFAAVPEGTVYAAETNSIYDELKKNIKEKWNRGMDEIEEVRQIEIKGNFFERIIRSIANVFYGNITSIKAGSLFIGVLSVALGIIMASVAKLNKGIKRFAIGVLIIAIPVALFIFVFGISKFVSLFS